MEILYFSLRRNENNMIRLYIMLFFVCLSANAQQLELRIETTTWNIIWKKTHNIF
ncbi:hypothetical protein J2X31_000718 [Flavobacterium arsenatis]|uniref:Uncharacterized protein n=1 Tax=Flavobacterium arsenatis TaxID=1484332 RepID=A0ABU1TL71_9FLAO|nr:hypothetical protein [Flavobacterium arsenatis]